MKKQVIGILLIMSVLTLSIFGCAKKADIKDTAGNSDSNGGKTEEMESEKQENTEPVRHEIPEGVSGDENPLKGLIPFQGSNTDFPHSMEWFYIGVSEVQIAMNIFDWTALEEKLNECAEQGYQAVLRFYYDYPGEKCGVPQFLIDKGLEMKPYDEPDDLGGGGLCPDYSNPDLRESMKNFIKAFGAKYDGDSRIGFITEGLLGFWGEWHNWPYDEDLSDGKPDWSIPSEVYTEVYSAFDEAFKVTPLLVREPKWGVENATFNAGYHDDSFAYATLPSALGGQEWSFGQKLTDLEQTEKWKENCIGGEVYPPIQEGVFNNPSTYPDWIEPEGRQDFETCINTVHPTWLICDRIKLYQGDARDRAIEFSKKLGYDFRVKEATFSETVNDKSFDLDIVMENIGVAPFYYNASKWPVLIGFKNEEGLVAMHKTDWNLSSVPADGSAVSFSYSLKDHKLGKGDYEVCIKVSNPHKGGRFITFANEGGKEDGWLTLGNIHVNGEAKKLKVIEEVLPIVY
ncbi:MAG: DUF4832 domain-containing protein [Lachnospiraceae bacterium]|nr:DUF4832 domain-containing protein [Lachnospiraceae bacterium]